MAKEVGKCLCPECGKEADVMADKREFLYLNCKGKDGCGIFKYQSFAGQAKLKARLEKYQNQQAANDPEAPEEPKADSQNQPQKKRRSLFRRREAA